MQLFRSGTFLPLLAISSSIRFIIPAFIVREEEEMKHRITFLPLSGLYPSKWENICWNDSQSGFREFILNIRAVELVYHQWSD